MWAAIVLNTLRLESAAPHSIDFESTSDAELRLCATRPERLFAALRKGDAYMERTRLNLPYSFVPAGAKHWILSGGRWMLSCVAEKGQIYCWDLGSSHSELSKRHSSPCVIFDMPKPYQCRQLVLQSRPQDMAITIVIYDDVRQCCHICSITWTEDPKALPKITHENMFEILGAIAIDDLPLCIEGDYVLLSGGKGLIVWNWRKAKKLVISMLDPDVYDLIPLDKVSSDPTLDDYD